MNAHRHTAPIPHAERVQRAMSTLGVSRIAAELMVGHELHLTVHVDPVPPPYPTAAECPHCGGSRVRCCEYAADRS